MAIRSLGPFFSLLVDPGKRLWNYVEEKNYLSRWTMVEVAVTVSGLAICGYLYWQLMQLESRNGALEERLNEAEFFKNGIIGELKIPTTLGPPSALEITTVLRTECVKADENSECMRMVKENYQTLNGNSLTLWMNAPNKIKDAIAPNPLPILDLDYSNPSKATIQINSLTQLAYNCYGEKAHLQENLSNSTNRWDSDRRLLEQRHSEVVNGKDDVLACRVECSKSLEFCRVDSKAEGQIFQARLDACKDEKAEAVQSCQTGRSTEIQSCQAEWKAEVQSCKDERAEAVQSCQTGRSTEIQSCQTKWDASVQSCKDERVQAAQSCKNEKEEALQSCKDERVQAAQSCKNEKDKALQSCQTEWKAEVQSSDTDCKVKVQSSLDAQIAKVGYAACSIVAFYVFGRVLHYGPSRIYDHLMNIRSRF